MVPHLPIRVALVALAVAAPVACASTDTSPDEPAVAALSGPRPPGTCGAPPEPVSVDPGDTYLGSFFQDDEGRPLFVHVAEGDMPWRVAIGKPRRPPKYGSSTKAREVAIEAMKSWEKAIQPHLPWFRLEFVEEDPGAPVQVNWKRRMTGEAAGRGGPRWWREGDCLRVGGEMDLTTRYGNSNHTQLTIDELEMIVAHEFGHVLGLGHCLDCDSAMSYAWHQRDRIYVTDLDVRTFLGLVSIPNGAVGVLVGPAAAAPEPAAE